ncbi:MAG: hypothetical protein ACOCUF_01825 [Patescibacteria group bacterium]
MKKPSRLALVIVSVVLAIFLFGVFRIWQNDKKLDKMEKRGERLQQESQNLRERLN